MEDLKFHWTNGRNLSSITYTDDNNEVATLISFKYDDNGIRVSKTYGDTTTYYTTINGTITSQYELDENDNPINVIEFIYDSNDEIIGFTYNNNTYFYIKNIQGDITNIVDNTGNVLVNYYYDAWGVPYSENLSNDNLAEINPMRYRGYYYDCEMGLYYLQSRYYIPTFCRFLNSDLPEYAQVQKDDYAGTNLFAYCVNDPVNKKDSLGTTYLNTYVNIISIQVSGNYITIKYKVKAKVPGISLISIGYEYPSSTRTNGSEKIITNRIGTHSMKFKTVGLRCYYRIYGIFNARNYNEKTIIKTLSNYPTGKRICYHEVSAKEEIRERIALTIFNIACWIDWKKTFFKIAFRIASACSIISTFANNSPPQPKEGHYYKIVSYYSGNYIYTELYIWNSKKSYNHGDYPIYKSKTKTEIPHF